MLSGGGGAKLPLRVILKPITYILSKMGEKKTWQREEVVQPLLDEISEAADGNLPRTRGERESRWQELDEAIRDRVDPDLLATFNLYIHHLEKLNQLHEREYRLGREMATTFPQGGMEDEIPKFATETVSQTHGAYHSDPELIKSDIVEWVGEVWDAFEKAESPASLEMYLRSAAQRPAAGFGEGVIDYWEANIENPPWYDRLWELYNQDIIGEFYEISQDRKFHRMKAIEKADEIDGRLRNRNRGKIIR